MPITFSMKYLWFYKNQLKANDCEKVYHMKILLLITPLTSAAFYVVCCIGTIVYSPLLSPWYERYQFLMLPSACCPSCHSDCSDTEHRSLAHHPAWGTAFTCFQTSLVFSENRAMSQPAPSLHWWTWKNTPSPRRSWAAEVWAMSFCS